jgi:hypothetical protein
VANTVPEHRIIITLSTEALRRGLDLVERGAYESLDAAVDALLLNGSAPTRGGPSKASAMSPRAADDLLQLLERPAEQPMADLAEAAEAPRGNLLFLTNRLNPLKVSARVLASLARAGEWPELNGFQVAASRGARELGLRIRAEDREVGRRGAAKRFVGYPVGDDTDAALGRFISSFTIEEVGGRTVGPLAVLGLAALVDGRAVLTEAGWRLAAAPNPLLDGGDGSLGREEIEIFKERLCAAVDERTAITDFLAAVHRAAGAQPRVDELLSTSHQEWSSDRAAAHRAAMLGRLGELGVLRVSGRGSRAQIELLDTDGLAHDQGGSA